MVLLFGASGSAGGCVLDMCLAAPDVKEVRSVVRRPLGMSHPKLREIRHTDFASYSGSEQIFAGVDACLFCLGKSVTQVSGEPEYRRITCDFSMAAALALREQSPDAVFHYVSGQGASLTSRFMWARVKAEAERALLDRVGALCWRPAGIDGKPSVSEPLIFKMARPAYRLFRSFRSLYVSGDDIGLAMLQAMDDGVRERIIKNAELRDMADRRRASQAAAAMRTIESR